MFQGLKILKKYYNLAKVKAYLLILEFLFLLIPSILSILSTVLNAKLITAITVYDFSKATFLLTLDFVFIVVSALSYFFYYLLARKINKTIVFNFQNHLYTNIKANKNSPSISLSVLNNINTLMDFNKNLLYKTCFFIKSIILLSIIIHYNLIIGFVLIGVSFLSYFLLKITDSKIQTKNSELSKYQIQSVELFNSIRQGSGVEQNYNLENSLKDKYFGYVETGIKTTNQISLYYNINNNFITLILKTAVFVSTLFLISAVKSTTLTLSLYLILTPYLSSSAQNLIAFFDIFSEFGIVDNILCEFEALRFQEKPAISQKINFSTYNIYFFQASLTEPDLPKIENLDLKIEFGSLVNFVGEKDCGKRAVFYLLKRAHNPSTGSVFIDSKNISDINIDDYKKLVSSTESKPHFFNISIQENLMLVCMNKSKITNTIKAFGLKELIDALPNKANTVVSAETNSHLLFFLGIARSYLTDAKIINIYEVPVLLNSQELTILKKILHFLKRKRTVLLFTHTDDFSELCDKTLYIQDGKVKNINKN